jgi:hypothetical protein
MIYVEPQAMTVDFLIVGFGFASAVALANGAEN